MSTATASKFQSDAKQLACKRLQERKKGVLVLILRHLADSGYVDAYKKLESEANLSLDQVGYHVIPISNWMGAQSFASKMMVTTPNRDSYLWRRLMQHRMSACYRSFKTSRSSMNSNMDASHS